MSPDELEEAVASYLERLEAEPGLEPDAFAASFADDARQVADAIHGALAVRDMLPAGLGELEQRPQSIGGYRVLHEVGRGGMGIVYAVQRDGRTFALKLLPLVAAHGERGLARFRREAQVLGRLSHPGIVRVFDSGSHEGSPYIVMEHVAGESLPQAAARIGARAAAQLVRDLALAVQAAHDAGVLHRDLKPQNVVLRPDGRPVLLDFGLVCSADDDVSLTSTGDVLGTLRYMAPEQALGRKATVRTDVYGLGQILFELAVGRPAHSEGSRTRVLSAVSAGRIPRARSLKPGLERDLDLILAQALAREPSRRFASAHELAQDLQRFLDGEPVLARRPPVLVRAADQVRAFPLRSLTAAAALMLVLVAAGTAFVAYEQRAAERRSELDRLLDRAYWAWVQGSEQRARREASAALRIEPRARDAQALLVHLGSDLDAPGTDGMLRGLAAYQAQRYDEARKHFAAASAADARSLPAAFLTGRCLRLDGEPADARERLRAAVAAWPASSSLAAELAATYGPGEAALSESRRAAQLNPSDPFLREALARQLLAAGEVREGVLMAHQAAALAREQGEGTRLELYPLLEAGPDMAAVRAVLEEMLAAEPGRNDTRFALATSLDSDHRVVAARAHYEEVLRRDPQHLDAMLHLAWLQAGASREHCETCRVAFDAAPELVDPARAQQLLLAALELDRGRDEELLRRIVNIATDKGFVAEVTRALEQQSALAVPGTAHALHIASALRRLRNAAGAGE